MHVFFWGHGKHETSRRLIWNVLGSMAEFILIECISASTFLEVCGKGWDAERQNQWFLCYLGLYSDPADPIISWAMGIIKIGWWKPNEIINYVSKKIDECNSWTGQDVQCESVRW